MMSISMNEVAGVSAPVSSNGSNGSNGSLKRSRLLPGIVTAKRSQPSGSQSSGGSIGSTGATAAAEEENIRKAFVDALTANQRTLVSLTEATQAAIEAGFDRDDCIQWGLDAGLSDGYVRSTVSRLFIELVGRVKKAGGGRKRGSDAIRIAKLTLKYTKGNYKKAKALLLAARRALEAMEKQSLKD
jgi:hypothetical protein